MASALPNGPEPFGQQPNRVTSGRVERAPLRAYKRARARGLAPGTGKKTRKTCTLDTILAGGTTVLALTGRRALELGSEKKHHQRHACSFSPCAPVWLRLPVPLNSPRSGRDGVCVSPCAATSTRQAGASPPPSP